MRTADATLVNWNVEWRKPGSPDGLELRARIAALDPDIVCLTEADIDFFAGTGHTITSESDYGYPIKQGRRKVVLWSKQPWSDVSMAGERSLPPGRYVRGQTDTPVGELDVIGVCIPWSGAHVSTGRKDRARWQDHLLFLDGLAQIIPKDPRRLIVVGDFNQRIPRSYAPPHAYEALEQCILSKLVVPTVGRLEPLLSQVIDHVAHSADLNTSAVRSLSNISERDTALSDHIGVCVELSIAP